MPKEGSVGHSDNTPVKQEHLGTILGTVLAVTGAILAKGRRLGYTQHQKFVYFDLTAGAGVVDGKAGSPLIFLRAATLAGMPFDAHFFEEDPQSFAALEQNIKLLETLLGGFPGKVSCWQGDSNVRVREAIDAIGTRCASTYGLAYMDPNGHKVPVKAMTSITEYPRLQKLDVLVHVAGTAYKRVAGRFGIDVEFSRDIRQAGKKLILIRDPIGAWQWTFALMSNWVDMPKFKTIGFHQADSPDGVALERRINAPSPKARPRTGPMPSTSGTPGSGQSERSSLSGLAVAASAVGFARQPNHTTYATPLGEPSTSPKTCSPSAISAIVNFTGNPIEDGWCFSCGGAPFCTACDSPRHLGYGNGRLLCWCDEPIPATCHDCRPDLHPEDERWFDH